MNITYLRQLNDQLRQSAIDSLRQLNDAEVFAPYVETCKNTLVQCEQTDSELDLLEKEVDALAK